MRPLLRVHSTDTQTHHPLIPGNFPLKPRACGFWGRCLNHTDLQRSHEVYRVGETPVLAAALLEKWHRCTRRAQPSLDCYFGSM